MWCRRTSPNLLQPLATAVSDLISGFSNTTELKFAMGEDPKEFNLAEAPSVAIGPALPPWARPEPDPVSMPPPAAAAPAPEAPPTLLPSAQPIVAIDPLPPLGVA